MLAHMLSGFQTAPSNDDNIQKRKHTRRVGDKCVCLVDNMPYPIENWSMGGVLLRADSRSFQIGQEVSLVMKFKVRGEMVNIPVQGEVVRRTSDGVAFRFKNISSSVRHAFQNIISDVITLQFVDSQANLAS